MTQLIYGPLNRPRPYADITEVDPSRVTFDKSVHWAMYLGFYDQHHEDYSSKLEPEQTGFDL